MIKVVVCAARKPGLSVEEFQRHWRERHGPLVARIPGVRRYVQSHPLPESYDGPNPPPYDGLAEIWWDDLEARARGRQTPEYRTVAEDELRFVDHGRSVTFVTEERFIAGE
ncbi:MAG: EthD domain-containing protein [Dehalococcoidia bacterium]